MLSVVEVTEENLEEARSYLDAYAETSQFLIGNLIDYGPRMGDHHNSGNFRMIKEGSEVTGVFALAKRGNLLARLDRPEESATLVLEACAREPVALRGFIGDWKSMEPICRLFKARNPDFKPGYESKEILYRYVLDRGDTKIVHDPRVRLLEKSDYSQYFAHSRAYNLELKLPEQVGEEAVRREFEMRVETKVWWGLFEGETLASMASLNAWSETIGQVGGVFTPPERRQRGLSKATMLHLLKDCRDLHGHSKSILFTGQTDIAAQKLYESIGYERIGHFALIFE